VNWMDDDEYLDGTDEDQAWSIVSARVGRAVGMEAGDDSLSSMVTMQFGVKGYPEKIEFVLEPDHADMLADALKDSAQKAREELP
jgi:hypothetical protein